MTTEKYITIPEMAKLLGVSRIAIYNRVKKGQIPAKKIGRTYVITDETVADILGREVTAKEKKLREVTAKKKKLIDAAVDRTVREYGEVLKLLGKE